MKRTILAGALGVLAGIAVAQETEGTLPSTWTLQQCIDYALEHNIALQQSKVSTQQQEISLLEQKAALFPSLSFSTNQNVSWRPWSESYTNLSNGTMTTSSSEVNYNGSYGLNASWTVWNGGRNLKNIDKAELTTEISELSSDQQANSIQEQITQYYVQILYQTEAVEVNKSLLETSTAQRDRCQEMVNVGLMAKADLSTLQAQVTQDEYNVVSAQTQLASYKLQLKQLLELVMVDNFEVAIPSVDDSKVLAPLPTIADVYAVAYSTRPEIQSSRLSIESADLDISIARAGYWPSVSLSAGIGSSNTDDGGNFFDQLKTNMSNSLGLTISVPIFDNRSTRSSIQTAKLSKLNSQLDLQNAEQELYAQIETYWLNARSAQQQYIYAKANEQSMADSYELVNEQFNVGLKNIVDLMQGKDNLLQAEQQLLQSKYTALLNIALLKFYQGETISL